jgi:hypothetical protein
MYQGFWLQKGETTAAPAAPSAGRSPSGVQSAPPAKAPPRPDPEDDDARYADEPDTEDSTEAWWTLGAVEDGKEGGLSPYSPMPVRSP